MRWFRVLVLVPVLVGVGNDRVDALDTKVSAPRYFKASSQNDSQFSCGRADEAGVRQLLSQLAEQPEIERGFDQANEPERRRFQQGRNLSASVRRSRFPWAFNNLGALSELNDKARQSMRSRHGARYQLWGLNLELDEGCDGVASGNAQMSSSPWATCTCQPMVEAESTVTSILRRRRRRGVTGFHRGDNWFEDAGAGPEGLTEEGRITDWNKITRKAGGESAQTIAPAPNTTLFFEISGHDTSAGAYTLLVRPLKAFDTYEPNDDIFNAPASRWVARSWPTLWMRTRTSTLSSVRGRELYRL